jgi:hypothetical protein
MISSHCFIWTHLDIYQKLPHFSLKKKVGKLLSKLHKVIVLKLAQTRVFVVEMFFFQKFAKLSKMNFPRA